MAGELYTDRRRLVGDAYRTSGNLSSRANLYRYATRPLDLRRWVLGQVAWAERGALLDVGCGPGWYLRAVAEEHPAWTGVGVDLSPGMAAETAHRHPALVGDAQALPFRADAFDLVLAAHMRYRVPEPGRAAAELARVCRPDGRVLVVLNGHGHQAELLQLVSESSGVAVQGGAGRLALDDAAALLSPALEVVTTDVLQDDIVVTEPGPVMAYIQSTRPMVEPRLRGFVNWTTVLARSRAVLEHAFAEHGEWRTTLALGVLVCRPCDP